MAIARGAGTEIIRCASFENISNVTTKLIIGVQHHIYTVLSIIIQGRGRSGTEKGYLKLYSFDSLGGTSAQDIHLQIIDLPVGETFVWNDKFSFNGCEPVDEGAGVVGAMTTAAEQDAIADQGTTVSQYIGLDTDSGSTYYDVVVTFIDQNNA